MTVFQNGKKENVGSAESLFLLTEKKRQVSKTEIAILAIVQTDGIEMWFSRLNDIIWKKAIN